MQDASRVDVVDSNDAFLVSDSEILLFVVDGCACKFLCLIGPE